MKVTLKELINAIESHEGMYVTPVGFENVVSYLEGFSAGMKAVGHRSQLDGFQDWVEKKVGHKSSSHWSWLIKEEIAKGDDGKAFKLFYSYIHDFLVQDS